jgi:hypothetical protein
MALALAIVLVSSGSAQAAGKLLPVVDDLLMWIAAPNVTLDPILVQQFSEISLNGITDNSALNVYVYFMSGPFTAFAGVPKVLAAVCTVDVNGMHCPQPTIKVAGPYLAIHLQLQGNDVIVTSLKAWAAK